MLYGPCHEAQVPAMVPTTQEDATTWTPPPARIIKVNVDAAFPEQLDDFWVSMVARDSHGTLCLVESEEDCGPAASG